MGAHKATSSQSDTFFLENLEIDNTYSCKIKFATNG